MRLDVTNIFLEPSPHRFHNGGAPQGTIPAQQITGLETEDAQNFISDEQGDVIAADGI